MTLLLSRDATLDRRRYALTAGPPVGGAYALTHVLSGVALVAVAAVLVAVALPPTLARLRSAALPPVLAALVVVPVVNAVAVAALSLVPSARELPGPPSRLARLVPGSAFGSALAGVVVTGVVGVALVFLGANVLELYGWALFIGTPFCLGLFAGLVHSAREPRDAGSCALVGVAAAGLAAAGLVLVALEGVICIVMALPIALPLAALGGFTAYLLRRGPHVAASAQLPCAVLLVLPALMGFESAAGREAALVPASTSVVVDAPPGVVWRHVVAVERLPPPRERVFRAGVAYPTRATIQGSGVGAVRRCRFSTGDFVEPIRAWEPGRRLAFDVVAQPAPMRELSPYDDVEPPHLDGFLLSRRGEFLLTPLPGGRTLLRGTSWYQNRMWPGPYWRLWSDALIHRIHLRVLRHVKAAAETEAVAEGSASF